MLAQRRRVVLRAVARLTHAPVKRDFVDIATEFSMASITRDHEILIMGVDGGWNHSTVDALREVAMFSPVEREVAMKHCNMLAFGEGTTNEVRRAHKADDVAFALHSGWTHRPASRCPDLGLRTVDGGEARVSHQPLQHPMRLAYFVEMVVVCAL